LDAVTSNILSIAEVAVALGFVIFIHELGHFALAKWNGVKVEKFSIGFGPTILGFKRGETDYVIAAIPLGGFVKMLGEGVDDDANRSADPRAYPNKSVGARMAIISAGVVMNLILGLVCFVYVYKMGVEELPTRVGNVIAGQPAYTAGLRVGDEIIAMDGRRDLSFNNLQLRVRLSGKGQVVHFDVKRPGVDRLIPFDIEPRREGNAEMPGIGVQPAAGLLLAEPPYETPAGGSPSKDQNLGLKPDDRVIAAAPAGQRPEPVEDVQELDHRFLGHPNDSFDVVVRREAGSDDKGGGSARDVTVRVPPSSFVDFGFRLMIEPIAAVRVGSPADVAGFRPGDRIVRVDGRDDFDPMRLPSRCFENAGKPMTFEVERAAVGESPKVLVLTATPDDTTPWTHYPLPEEPIDATGLGLAYQVRPRIAAVKAGSPAEKAGLKVGDVINSLTFAPLKDGDRTVKSPPIDFDQFPNAWASTFRALQLRPLAALTLKVNNATRPVVLTPEADPSWPHPWRGLQFQPLTRRTPPMDVATALRRGLDDTLENIVSIYAMFRSLAQGRVSPKQLGGPLMIFGVAKSAAQTGFTVLVRFLGILSINLAVLNFLPIPPLDGGQMVFLMAEKVRGRPLPDSALNAGQLVGLGLVLLLMGYVLIQDILRYVDFSWVFGGS
jgi:regulator of sigma E protease